MDIGVVLLLLFSVTMGVIGQYFFKTGMGQIGKVEMGPHVVLYFFRPLIATGLVCYAIATVSWLVILSRAPLSVAYPCISMSYVFVVLMGKIAFHEEVTPGIWAGVFLICSGVILIGLTKAATSAGPS